MYFIAKIEKAL
ncbi:transcription termination factor 1, partial [Trichinella spiralis]